MAKTIVIGTRGSKLAMWQSEHIKKRLGALFPDFDFTLRIIKTTGDLNLDTPLADIGDKGLFTKQIEAALLAGEIDLAVHSLKDLPTAMVPGLDFGAITKREDPRDAFVSKNSLTLSDLPSGAKVATGSLRRRAQLLNHRADLVIEPIRGNLDTRLRKLDENPELSAIILANAGLVRLGFSDRITHLLEIKWMLPAVGQGALAVQIREDDESIRTVTATLNHLETEIAVRAERALLGYLEGGCQVPIGAYGRMENSALVLDAMVADVDGKKLIRETLAGKPEDSEGLGHKLAETLVEMGADKILSKINAEARSGQ